MPDITMCHGEGCPVKNDCYRFRAEPNPYRQSYFAKTPANAFVVCEYFTRIEPGDRLAPARI